MINDLISPKKKKKKKILKLFSRDLIAEFSTQTQFRWHKSYINISETAKKKKGFLYWRVGIYSDNKERIKFHEWERENDIPNWVGASSKWLIVSQIIKGIKPSELSGGIQDLLLELEFGIIILWFIIIKINWLENKC